MGALKQAHVIVKRAGERAAFVPEEFALEQGVGDGRTVLHHKGAGHPGAGVVDGTRHQFFAAARLALDQHRNVIAGQPRGHFAHRVQRAACRTLDAVKVKQGARLFQALATAGTQGAGAAAQVQLDAMHLMLQRARLHRAAHHIEQMVGHPGLEHIAEDAGLVDAGNQVFAVGIARDDDAHALGPALAHLLQKLHAADVGHALIAEDDTCAQAFQQFTRLLHGTGGADFKLFFQRAAHGFQRTHFIVEQQHAGQLVSVFAVQGHGGARLKWG